MKIRTAIKAGSAVRPQRTLRSRGSRRSGASPPHCEAMLRSPKMTKIQLTWTAAFFSLGIVSACSSSSDASQRYSATYCPAEGITSANCASCMESKCASQAAAINAGCSATDLSCGCTPGANASACSFSSSCRNAGPGYSACAASNCPSECSSGSSSSSGSGGSTAPVGSGSGSGGSTCIPQGSTCQSASDACCGDGAIGNYASSTCTTYANGTKHCCYPDIPGSCSGGSGSSGGGSCRSTGSNCTTGSECCSGICDSTSGSATYDTCR